MGAYIYIYILIYTAYSQHLRFLGFCGYGATVVASRLGSLDDALNLAALQEHEISAIVNMALSGCMHLGPSGVVSWVPTASNCGCFPHCVLSKSSYRVRVLGGCVLETKGIEIIEIPCCWKCFPTWLQFKVHQPRYSLLLRGSGEPQHAFSADWYESKLNLESDMRYLLLDADDHPHYPISSHFQECGEFLSECKKEGRKVLVHCVAGQNRSATICAAFLIQEAMKGNGPLSLEDAAQFISCRRQGASHEEQNFG